MSKHFRPGNTRLEKTIADLQSRQRNIVWPDAVVNANRVNRFLFKGARDAPLIQRIGGLLFGIVFVIGALANFSSSGSVVVKIVSLAIISVGVIFCVNAVRGWRLKRRTLSRGR
jgi:hypothetical protein